MSVRNTPVVVTRELSLCTTRVVAVELVSAVTTIVLMVALPGLEDAPSVATPVLGCGAGVVIKRMVVIVMVGPLSIPSQTKYESLRIILMIPKKKKNSLNKGVLKEK